MAATVSAVSMIKPEPATQVVHCLCELLACCIELRIGELVREKNPSVEAHGVVDVALDQLQKLGLLVLALLVHVG